MGSTTAIYATTTAISTLNSAFSDTGILVALVLAAVVGGTIALMGLGFGIRHVKKWITGKRF